MSWLSIVVGAAIAQAVSEFVGLFDLAARWLIRRCSRSLPEECRGRYVEEWAAELQAIPGSGLWRLLFAIRVCLGARATARELGTVALRVPFRSQLVRAGFMIAVFLLGVFLAPLTITLTVLIAAIYGRPVFRSRVVQALDGGTVRLYSFNAPQSSRVGRFLDSTDLDALPSLLPMARGRIWPTVAQLRIVAADVWHRRPTRPFDDAD